MIYGYVRVSTKKQEKGYSLDEQEARILSRYPEAYIIKEVKQGNKDRPAFDDLIKRVRDGDLIVTVDHTRFSRDASAGLKVAKDLMDRGVLIHFLSFGLLENTPTGRFVLTMLLANAELEVSSIAARTQPARKTARKKAGYHDGRPKKFGKAQLAHAVGLMEAMTVSEVVKKTGISKSTLLRYKKRFSELEEIH